ncbi:hypothetical protein CAL7716_105680 (plasmid) [Calothrix sp. PCC 7716]|nr:hypothetical protein CAL7716_105680 [Calothrix sp. PCC 7716]
MTLNPDQRKQLKVAFLDAFPTPSELRMFLKEELDKNLDELVSVSNLREIVFELIRNAEANGWETKLIFAARKSNPGNPKLAAFVRAYEREYWQKLAREVNSYEAEEADANQAIVDVKAEVIRVIDNQPNINDELKGLLLEIRDKLNEPGTPAAAKAKLALPLIPGIVSYEVELDTENSLRRVFQPIKQLYKKAFDEGK